MMTNECGAAERVAEELRGMRENEERYIVLARSEGRRVALTARREAGATRLTVEVQLRLTSTAPGRELEGLGPATEEAKALLSQGYSPGRQEEAWACCEKPVGPETLEAELEAILGRGRERR